MKGAEIALVEGVAVSFGSGDDCDVIVQDATVPAKACEIEVDATGVRIAVGGGSSESLPAFEIRSFGTTSFAVGPVDGEWQDLIKPVRPAVERADPETADAPVPEDVESASRRKEEAPSDADATGTSRRRKTGFVTALLVLLLLVLIVLLAWLFWPRIVEKCPKVESARVLCVEKGKAWYAASRTWVSEKMSSKTAKDSTSSVAPMSLADLASTHGLVLTNYPLSSIHYPLLQGNLKRRTERLAIRALALSADPSVKFDLTDDETLFSSSSELLFACSDGALKVDAAKNRVVTISGYAPSCEALERAIRALNADVKGIDRLDTSHVRVGGTAPAAVAKTPFVREAPPGEHPVVAIPAHTPEPPVKKTEKAQDYPIAGILTAPYPCVVMRNGVRLVEGAQIGRAVLVKIEADKLTLRDGNQDVEWKP